jgi:transposase
MRVSAIVVEVQEAWKRLSRALQRQARSSAMTAPEAALRDRFRIVLNLARGNPPPVIHAVLRCSVSQVYRIAARFVQQGLPGLADYREENGTPKITEDYAAELLKMVGDSSPRDYDYRRPTWTQELLALVMEERTEIRISQSSMCRLLRVLEIRLGRPKPVVGCPWAKRRRTRRLRAIQRLIDELPENEVVLYADEVDIHLNPKIGPDYMLRGTQKTVLTPGKNQKRYLAGALNAKTGRITWVAGEEKNSDLFIRQLWTLLKKDYPKAKRIHIILDNFRIHDSQKTRLALAACKDKIKLHFLPPYCPDHNRIERVWKDLHDNVTRNHRCATMEALMQEVHAYLEQRHASLGHQYATYSAA